MAGDGIRGEAAIVRPGILLAARWRGALAACAAPV